MIYVMEVGNKEGQPFKVAPQKLPVPQDAANDFPVSITCDSASSIAYMISKMGYLYVIDIFSAKVIYRGRVSQDTVFCTIPAEDGAIIGITARTGKVLSISLNKSQIVPYILSTLKDAELAIALSGRLSLPGAEQLYQNEFERLISSNDTAGAARLSRSSGGALRTAQTIDRFKSLPQQPGQAPPLLQYFSILLETEKLNEHESIELAKPVLAQNPALLEKWLREEKLHCSELLGDCIMQSGNVPMALSVYLRAACHSKAIGCFAQRGEYDKIVSYAKSVGHDMDYMTLLNQLIFNNPEGALSLAKALVSAEGGSLIDIQAAAEAFLNSNRIQETTAFLLEALKENKPEHAYLQTKLLEINLSGGAPQVADAILQNKVFTHYDKPHIARLLERAQLYQRAAENFTDISDIKRVFKNSHTMNPEFIVEFFSTLSKNDALMLMKDMLSRGASNIQVCVEVAKKFSDELGAEDLIDVFETFNAVEGLFYYLGSIVNFSEDPLVHFTYIKASSQLGQFKECERVCRDSTIYDPDQVKSFLKDAKLADPRPLIHVCDRHDFVEELTEYLYSNSLLQYIEVYCTKVSPQKTPQVVGKLLELDSNEDFIKKLLMAVGVACPVEDMVEIAEGRNRLRLLQPWLEASVSTGSTDASTHNALGKIYVTANKDPKTFLQNNMFYDSRILGNFCEALDPALSFIAFKRAKGECDEELIRISHTHSLYRDLAKYAVEKQDEDLWAKVLTKDPDTGGETPEMRSLVEQVVEWALPESENADEVSATVKAFLAADIPGELIQLLERIVLQGSDFSENPNLQNLLILTAVKAAPDRVMDYIDRLDHFDGPEIAKIAQSEQYELYEEAYCIYRKFSKKEFTSDADVRTEMMVSALSVLVDKLQDLERAQEYAVSVNEKPVWSRLGEAQLDAKLPSDAIKSFLAASDPKQYVKVCSEASDAEIWAELIPFLRMARETIKENFLDTELIFCFAKTGDLASMEEFVNGPNCANIQAIGDRCFNGGQFDAAKVLFISINNNAKLALCHVHLREFREAVTAAGKANAVSTWKAVCWACIESEEFRLASSCGLHIITAPDHLDDLIGRYEAKGYFDELINLMEQGLGLDDAHIGIFTELAILYSKYQENKLMEHLKIFMTRLNVKKVVKACERARLWKEANFCYVQDKQFDSAIKTMSEREVCFSNDTFLDCITKVRNQELVYKTLTFYLNQHASELPRLLSIVSPQLDAARVVHLMRKAGDSALYLSQEYFRSVQSQNLSAVNTVLNELYIEDEDYESLRTSVNDYQNFDQISLAQSIEKHELLEFRRLAAYVYATNKRWEQSINLSKGDKMYKDAIDTALRSAEPPLIDSLLRFFCDMSEKECFSACLYTCYKYVSPDLAVELGWRNNYVDFVMPFMIQNLRDTHVRLKKLEGKLEQEEKKDEDEGNVNRMGGGLGFGSRMLMIGDGSYGAGAGGAGMGGVGMGVGGMGMGQQYSSPQGLPEINMR